MDYLGGRLSSPGKFRVIVFNELCYSDMIS